MMVFAMALPLDIIIWTIGLSYRATNKNWRALKIFALRTVVNLTLAALLVPRVGFIGIPWAYLIADVACAGLLLHGFAAGLFSRMVRTGWWLFPSILFAYLCGRVSVELLLPGGNNAKPIPALLTSACSFIASYVLISVVLAPKEYRDRVFEFARGVNFGRRRRGIAMQDAFNALPYSVVPGPQSLGCTGSEE
jgi:hypothetical protein